MPYKVTKSSVYVQRGSKWVMLKKHTSHAEALAHLRALQINVPEAHRGKR
jgi:hypothetical protein